MSASLIMAVVVVVMMIMVCGTFSFFLHPEHIFFCEHKPWNTILQATPPQVEKKFYIESMRSCFVHASLKGRVRLLIRMNFRKNLERPSTPPSFLKNYVANFSMTYMRGGWPDSTGIQKCLLQSASCFDFSQYNCWKNIPWTLKLLFCINFMIKKPCLKFPKSAI